MVELSRKFQAAFAITAIVTVICLVLTPALYLLGFFVSNVTMDVVYGIHMGFLMVSLLALVAMVEAPKYKEKEREADKEKVTPRIWLGRVLVPATMMLLVGFWVLGVVTHGFIGPSEKWFVTFLWYMGLAKIITGVVFISASLIKYTKMCQTTG